MDDEAWLRRQYAVSGDKAIALQLGVSSETVRRARVRFAIQSRPRGGQYGVRGVARRVRKPARSAGLLIAERIAQQSRSNGLGVAAPSRQMLATRTRALHEAFTEGREHDIEQALIELAAGCGLVFDHMQRAA